MKRAFISFDFDSGENLRNALIGQAKHSDSPFEVADWSVRKPFPGNWEEKVRSRIRKTNLTVVIYGEHTDKARDVAVELTITREEKKPYFLLNGRSNKNCKKPSAALPSDGMYLWTWDNLKKLIAGAR